jgi:hypothetical protein
MSHAIELELKLSLIKTDCGHEYQACDTVMQHQDCALPCPVCNPDYNYGETHTIHKAVLDDGAVVLTCCGCFHQLIQEEL